jgi:hypothetical protein
MPSTIEPTTKTEKRSTENLTSTTTVTKDAETNQSSRNWFQRFLNIVGISKPTPTPIQPYKVPDESSIYTQADSASESTDEEWDIVDEHDIDGFQPTYHTQITLILSEAAQARTAKHHNIPPKDVDDEELANEEVYLVQRALLDYAFQLMEAEKEVPLVINVMLDIAKQLEKEEQENASIGEPTARSTTHHHDDDNVEDDDDEDQSYVDDNDLEYKSDMEEEDDEEEDDIKNSNDSIYRL